MNAYIDATVLIGLGTIGELELLTALEADAIVLPAVNAEVTTEPARTAVRQAIGAGVVTEWSAPDNDRRHEAAAILDDSEASADTQLVAAVLEPRRQERQVAVVSDDRRVRTVTRGLGASVTGTIGVVVRAVDEGLDPAEAKAILRRLDQHGLHMTASLRQRAEDLIDEAAE